MSSLVLVADADPFNLGLLQELCEAAGYEVRTASTGTEVLAIAARERPDLLLLDMAMVGLDGLEIMRILKADADTSTIPVILITNANEVGARSEGIGLGADDYISKPYRVFEVQQRIRNALRVRAAEDEAAKMRDSFIPGTIDPLTRTGTSQQLTISLEYEFTRAVRYGHALTCMVVRLDNYQDIVKAMGQDAGDGTLVSMATGLRACIRGIDHLFRSDLHEFVILLPETDEAGAAVVRARIEEREHDRSLWGGAVEPKPRLRLGAACSNHAGASDGTGLLHAALGASRETG